MSSDPPHLAAYTSYIDFEIKNGDPVRVISICERAIVDNCLLPEIWLKYIGFMVSYATVLFNCSTLCYGVHSSLAYSAFCSQCKVMTK